MAYLVKIGRLEIICVYIYRCKGYGFDFSAKDYIYSLSRAL
jgi:hypothetical protein